MSFTFATLLFVPLAIWAAFRTKRTVAMLAGTVGFSATAVVNIEAIQFAVQPYHLFGLVLLGRALLDARVRRTVRLRRRVSVVLLGLVGFWLVAALSVAVATPGEQDRFYMVAQLGHLGFGIAVAWALSRLVRTPETLRVACRGFERGAVFIAAWGVMQFALNGLGKEYPQFIFNNSIGRFAYVEGQDLGVAGLIRASSTATEPSFLGRTLVIALALLLVRHARGAVVERRWMVAGALVILTALFMATSSTGLFGLAVLLGAGLVGGRRLRVQRAAAGLALAAAMIPLVSPALTAALIEVTLNKSQTGSFLSRSASIEQGKAAFAEHPWLGLGWGNLTVHDLPFKVLSNTGLVGAALLVLVLMGLLAGRVVPEHAGRLRPDLRALKLAVAVSVAMDWVAGWSYPYGDVWVVSGLLLAAFTFARPRLDLPAEPDGASLAAGVPLVLASAASVPVA